MYIQYNISGTQNNSKTPLTLYASLDNSLSVCSNTQITIYNDQGNITSQQSVQNQIMDQVLTQDGQFFVYLLFQANYIILYNIQQKQFQTVQFEQTNFTSIAASKLSGSSMIALGTQLGHIIVFDYMSQQKQVYASKLKSSIFSLQFAPNSEILAAVSIDDFCVMDSLTGNTLLQQKKLRYISPIKTFLSVGPDSVYDTLAIIVESVGGKGIPETMKQPGQYLVIANVDKQLLNSNGSSQLFSSMLEDQTYGFCVTQLENQNIIVDIQCSKNQICLLYNNNEINVYSTDHSRADMSLSVQNSKFIYGKLVQQRQAEYIQPNTLQAFQSVYQEMAALIQSSCQTNCLNSLQHVILTGQSILATNNYNVDTITQQEEKPYINFSENSSLGQLKHQITSIIMSNDQNLISVSTQNGSVFTICFKQLNKMYNQNSVVNNQCYIAVQTKPKGIMLSKLDILQNQSPKIVSLNDLDLPIEVQDLQISEKGICCVQDDKIVFGDFQFGEQITFNSQTYIQSNIKLVKSISLPEEPHVLPIVLTQQQTVIAIHNNKTLNLSVENQIISIESSENVIFMLDNKAVLHCIVCEVKEYELLYNEVANYQLSNQFTSGDVKLKIFPNFNSVLVYKENVEIKPQIVLLMEETVISDIFGDAVIIGDTQFDMALDNVFYIYLQNEVKQNSKDITCDHKLICQLCSTVADYQGPHVFFQVVDMPGNINKSQLGGIMIYGLKIQCNNGNLETSDVEPGLSSVAKLITQIAAQNVDNVEGQTQPENNTNKDNKDDDKQIFNPLLPVTFSQLENPMQNNLIIHNDIPKYKQYSPYIYTLFEQATLELLSIYSLDCAKYTAIASNNIFLIDQVIKHAIRICRIDIAQAMNQEKIIRMNSDAQNKKDLKLLYPLTQFQKTINTDKIINNPIALDKYIQNVLNSVTSNTILMGYICLFSQDFYNEAEKLFIQSNKPNLALQLRLDTQEYQQAAILAKSISTPQVRQTIIIQQAQEDENKGLYSQALDQINNLGILQKDYNKEWDNTDKNNYKYAFCIMVRCKCNLANYTQLKDEILFKKNSDNKFIIDFKQGKMNQIFTPAEYTKLIIEASKIIEQQKDYATAGEFVECAAYMSQKMFSSLQKEMLLVKKYTEICDLDKLEDAIKELEWISFLLPYYPDQLNKNIQQAKDAKNAAEDQFFDDADQGPIQISQDAEIQVLKQNLPQQVAEMFSTIDYQQLQPHNLLALACQLYIKARKSDDSLRLIQHVKDKSVIIDLAKTIMRERPEDSYKLFERVDSKLYMIQCLLLLDKVGEAEKIFKALKLQVQQTEDIQMKNELVQASTYLSEQFIKQQSNQKAVFYLMQAQKYNDAWKLAIQSQNEPIFIKCLNSSIPYELLKTFAKYYSSKEHLNTDYAAICLKVGKQYDIAIKMLCGQNTKESIIEAIRLLKKSEQSTGYVLKFITGGVDGQKKSPIYILYLYCSLRKYDQADRTVISLVQRALDAQQSSKALGLICQAKQIILDSFQQDQKEQETAVPHLSTQFLHFENLLFSLVASTYFSKHNKHYNAAICLNRIVGFRSLFKNQVQILLATVIESTRAKMSKEAYQAACLLVQEYNDQIPDKFKPQINNLIRKYKRSENKQLPTINCPICNQPQSPLATKCNDCGALLILDASTGVFTSYQFECPYCAHLVSRDGLFDTDGICLFCNNKINVEQAITINDQNYDILEKNLIDWTEYKESRPIIQFQGVAGQKRYSFWSQVYGDQLENSLNVEKSVKQDKQNDKQEQKNDEAKQSEQQEQDQQQNKQENEPKQDDAKQSNN